MWFELVGKCKLCLAEITNADQIDNYENMYECPECGEPNAVNEVIKKEEKV